MKWMKGRFRDFESGLTSSESVLDPLDKFAWTYETLLKPRRGQGNAVAVLDRYFVRLGVDMDNTVGSGVNPNHNIL